MSDTYEFILDVKDGKPNIYNRDAFLKFFTQFKDGERFHGTVTTKRTKPQNKLFHVWVGMLADYIGELDTKKLKKQLKYKMGWYEEFVNEETGEIVLEWEETSKWSKKKMRENLEKLNIFVHQFYGLPLPWPDEFREAN